MSHTVFSYPRSTVCDAGFDVQPDLGSSGTNLHRTAADVEVPTLDATEYLIGRETEILRLMAHGHADKIIVRELGVEERTVKTHVSSLLSEPGLSSRTQAALYALKTGLFSFE